MIIRRLKLENWMPFRGTHEVVLPAGAIAVVGEHDGNQRRSNWSGKTAGTIESVVFALWGWHRKRLAADVVTWGETIAWVEVEFDDGTVVCRGRGPAGATVECNDLKGKDAEDGIAKLLRLSRDDAFASSVIRQGDMTRFVDATSAERQAVMADWLDQAAWERCETRARDEARQADAKANVSALRVVQLREKLTVPQEDATPLEEKAAATRRELEEVEKLAGLHALVVEFGSAKERAAVLRARLARPPVEAPSLQRQADCDQALHHTRENLRDAERKRDWDGRCPVADGLDCPVQSVVKRRLPILKDRNAVVARLCAEIYKLENESRRLRDAVESARCDEGIRQAMSEEMEHLVARGRELKSSIAGIDLDAVRNADARRVELNSRLRLEMQRAVECRAQERLHAERETELDAALKERDEWIARADALWGAADAFGRNGIQAVEAEGALADLEARANRILEGTGLDVCFATARDGQKLESACRRCRHTYKGQKDKECPSCRTPRERSKTSALDVLVSADGGPRQDVSECSGGARALVGAAFRLAAAALLRQSRGSPFSVLLIDEPFASLDEEHRHLLARRLGEMARVAGFEQMLVVTHDRDLADALPARITVRQSGGFSTAEVET